MPGDMSPMTIEKNPDASQQYACNKLKKSQSIYNGLKTYVDNSY